MKKRYFIPIMALSLFSFVFIFSLQVNGEEETLIDKKMVCKQAKKDIKELKKEKEKLFKEKQKVDQEYLDAQGEFQVYHEQLNTMTGCTQGKPDNTLPCKKVLNGMRECTGKMNEIQVRQREITKMRVPLETNILKQQKLLEAYRCEEKK